MMKPPYNAMDVANYIVTKANTQKQPITHLKLQKLLYYVVAKHLKNTNQYLIVEPICKWQFGPVVKEVYHTFKTYGSDPIKEPYGYLTENSVFTPDEHGSFPKFILEFAKPDEINQQLDKDQSFVQTVREVMEELLSKGSFELVERTHQEEAWLSHKADIFARKLDLHYTESELRRANI